MARLILRANRGGNNGGVTIANGTTLTGYYLLDGINWGNYAADLVYSTKKDGTSTATDYNLPPRQVDIPVRTLGTTWAAANASLIALGKEVEACKRSGGVLTFQSNNATYPVYLTVRGAAFNAPSLVTNRTEMHFRTDGVLSLTCDPAAIGDAMGFRDDFNTDTSTSWTQGSGAWTIAAGQVSYGSTGLKFVRHTARGYNYTDVQVTMKVVAGASVTTSDWAVMARCQGSTSTDTALLARVVGAATNQIQFAKVVAGAITTLATAAFVPVINTTYWVRLRLEEGVGTAEVFTAEPKPLDAASATATATMSAADQQAFVSGACGFRSTIVAFAGERFDDFDVRPFTYKCASPTVLRLAGIPGDLPAMITSEVTVPSALATQAVFGGVMWAERQRQVNYCWNGNLEQTAAGNTQGWFNTTVAGVIGAASTGPTRNAAVGKFGLASVEFLTTAGANQGLNFPMPRRFRKGRTYIGLAWLQSAAGVGSCDLILGANGDLGTAAAAAVSATFKLYTSAWTPTADRDVAYLAPRHVAATAETVRADGMGVFEVTPQTQNGGITNVATSMPLTAVPPEGNPTLPCVFILEPGTANQELVRATAVDATGLIFTIDRGWDGSTAAAHATATAAYALPGYWFDANSDGVHGSMLDVIGVANPYTSSGITAMTVDATKRSGFSASGSTVVTSTIVQILVDPWTMIPPDFSSDELLIEVWCRYSVNANAPSPRFVSYSIGEDGFAQSPIRYDLENGSGGLAVLAPTGTVQRFARLGVVPIRFSDVQQRKRVQIGVEYDITATGTGIGFDYLLTFPAGQRATSPTGRLDDASYPDFLRTVSLQQTRRIFSDFASETGAARETMTAGNLNPAGGIVGVDTMLAFGAPNSDVLVKLSNLVPNGGVVADGNEALSIASDATLGASFNPTPRFLTLR